MKLLVSLAFLVFASANNTTKRPFEKDEHYEKDELPNNIITNGYTAPSGLAPYIVFLSFPNAWCGGTIIGHSWVLTAAHCTKPFDTVTIYYGSLRRVQGQIVHTVRGSNNFINHPNDDIALIRTPRVKFSNTINRVRLPRINENNRYVDKWALACGWGETHLTTHPDRLQCVDLKVISNAECRRTYLEEFTIDQILCATTPGGKSICYGDSGGPLVHNNLLVGISSFTSLRGCTAGDPSGFARITSHLNWIRDNTGIAY